MQMQETPSGERIHIGFFGRRNAGKSSLVNAITGQSISVVSDVKGTTTDPVKKAMELLPVGPVMIIDTPGFDDEGSLGEKRVAKTKEILAKIHVAVLVVDGSLGLQEADKSFLALVEEKKLPCIIVYNKADLLSAVPIAKEKEIWVSAERKLYIHQLKEMLASHAKGQGNSRRIVADLLHEGDMVVLVTPIDESAPKGRLILPQQQTIRDILDAGCSALVCQTENLCNTLQSLREAPKMVITDSQAFKEVAALVPREIPLTSFSILFARYKGDLQMQVDGAAALASLSDGDAVLIAEGCTHHRQCGDIGTVKMPAWIRKFASCNPDFHFTSGGEFPEDLSPYKLIVHCGGCMLNDAEMASRLAAARGANVPVVNYGIAIAHMHGILARSIEPFPDIVLHA